MDQFMPRPLYNNWDDVTTTTTTDTSAAIADDWVTTTTHTIIPNPHIAQPAVLQETGEEVADAPPPALPVPYVPEIDVETKGVDLDEYVRVARELGFEPPSLVDLKLGMFLQQQEIPCYDNQKVDHHLREWVEREHGPNGPFGTFETRHYWCWKPLSKDATKHKSLSARLGAMVSEQHGDVTSIPYDKHVPIEALKTAQRIKVGAPCEVEFFVSDYQAVRPDPFLMVRAAGGKREFVVAHWDEPGFSLAPDRD
jgi:hypothetical protein